MLLLDDIDLLMHPLRSAPQMNGGGRKNRLAAMHPSLQVLESLYELYGYLVWDLWTLTCWGSIVQELSGYLAWDLWTLTFWCTGTFWLFGVGSLDFNFLGWSEKGVLASFKGTCLSPILTE